MKKLLTIAVIAILAACNSKKEKQTVASSDTTTAPVTSPTNSTNPTTSTTTAGSGSVSYVLNDTARTLNASTLVDKDKDKLSPGNDLLAIVTASGSNDEILTVNFVFALKPGVYPVVGLGMTRPNQVFGGIMGGKPALTKYKVNLTEVTDLGSNNIGGHRWKLSGSIDEEVTIDAMSIMKLDPKHPATIKINKVNFSNLTFDDNMGEILNKLKVN